MGKEKDVKKQTTSNYGQKDTQNIELEIVQIAKFSLRKVQAVRRCIVNLVGTLSAGFAAWILTH